MKLTSRTDNRKYTSILFYIKTNNISKNTIIFDNINLKKSTVWLGLYIESIIGSLLFKTKDRTRVIMNATENVSW